MLYHKDIVWKDGFDEVVNRMIKIRFVQVSTNHKDGLNMEDIVTIVKGLKHNKIPYIISEVSVSKIIHEFVICFNYKCSIYYFTFNNAYDRINSLFYLNINKIQKYDDYGYKTKSIDRYTKVDDEKSFNKIRKSKNCYSYTLDEMKEELGIQDDTKKFN